MLKDIFDNIDDNEIVQRGTNDNLPSILVLDGGAVSYWISIPIVFTNLVFYDMYRLHFQESAVQLPS